MFRPISLKVPMLAYTNILLTPYNVAIARVLKGHNHDLLGPTVRKIQEWLAAENRLKREGILHIWATVPNASPTKFVQWSPIVLFMKVTQEILL